MQGVGVEAFTVPHVAELVCYGLRVEVAGRTILYSGDTGWTDDLAERTRDADLFICECYSGAPKMSNHIDWPLLRGKLPLLKAKRIALTHLGETALPMAGEMRAAGAAPAHDGMVVEL